MSLTAQISRICGLAAVVACGLSLARGVPPQPAQAAASGAVACTVPDDPGAPEIRWISVQEAFGLFDRGTATFVDCRPRELFEAGHVSGSLHIPAESAEIEPSLLGRLNSTPTVITYCDAQAQCERSLRMATLFQQAGIRDVRVLEGGLPRWLQAGYPAQSGVVNN